MEAIVNVAAIAASEAQPSALLTQAAAETGLKPEAFEIAVRLLTSTADQYFSLMAEVAQILDALKGPVRIEVATLNNREAEQQPHDPARQGAIAALQGKTLQDNPHTDDKDRVTWSAAFRRARRAANAE